MGPPNSVVSQHAPEEINSQSLRHRQKVITLKQHDRPRNASMGRDWTHGSWLERRKSDQQASSCWFQEDELSYVPNGRRKAQGCKGERKSIPLPLAKQKKHVRVRFRNRSRDPCKSRSQCPISSTKCRSRRRQCPCIPPPCLDESSLQVAGMETAQGALAPGALASAR